MFRTSLRLIKQLGVNRAVAGIIRVLAYGALTEVNKADGVNRAVAWANRTIAEVNRALAFCTLTEVAGSTGMVLRKLCSCLG